MVLGASHHDLELTHLERLSADADALRAALVEVVRRPDSPVAGAVLLATCNRLEIYADGVRFHDAVDAVTGALAATSGIPVEDVSGLLKVRVGAPVAAHLFAVTAGLDSMVVGEAEIAGQVARSFQQAQEAGAASPPIHLLFQSAARTAKRVASATGLGAAGRSVASVALDIATSGTSGLNGSRVLVVGTGAYARVVAAELRTRGCGRLDVFSPSGRTAPFVDRHGAVMVGTDELHTALVAADLVVSCSGNAPRVLTEETLSRAVADRDRPLPVIDLALRSDVPVAARSVPGVRVVDLLTVSAQVDPTHREALTAAQDAVIDGVAEFEDRVAQRRMDPAVVALRQHISGSVEKEMSRIRAKYPEDVAADVELALHRVTQSLLHTPTLRAKELARTGDTAGFLQALHTVFGIDLSAAAEGAQHPAPRERPA